MHMRKKPAGEKRLTIRQAYERYLLPDHERRRAAKTREGYRDSLRAWERYTDNPPIGAIKNATLAQFCEAYMAEGRAPASFNKIWRHLRAILRRLAPAETGNPLGEGIIAKVPYVEMLREESELPRVATADELNAMYEAAAGMQWPVSFEVAAADWWRTFLTVGLAFGPRIGDLLTMPTKAFHLEKRVLRFRANKTRKWHVLPFGKVVAAHVRRISSPRPLLFAPLGGPTMLGSRQPFYQAWHELQDRAKIEQHFGPHTLRRTCASMYFKHGGYELASYVLGHTARNVTMQFYVDPSALLKEVARKFDWPTSFRAILKDPAAGELSAAVRKSTRAAWCFTIDGATFRDRPLKLPRIQLALLRALVAAGRPLNVDELRAIAWRDRPKTSRRAIVVRVMSLRQSLVDQLGLPNAWNPLPQVSAAEGWRLTIPSEEEIRRASA